MGDGVDFAAEGLLDGLHGDALTQRRELLEQLHGDGVSLEELRTASREGTLVFVGADREVGGTRRYTKEEVTELTGLDAELGDQLLRAQGMPVPAPGERVLSEIELELARIAALYRDLGISEEEQLAVTRVLSSGLARTADVMREIALRLTLRPGASEWDSASAFATGVHELLPLVDPLLSAMMRQQLRNVVRSEAIHTAEHESGGLAAARDVVVCFADLVGFTRMGEEVPPDELGRIAGQLEAMALSAAQAPVRLVKSLGDGVMLVSPEPSALVDVTLDLVDRVDNADMPQLRVGIAGGRALQRAGDWFGRPVNLASRLCEVARAGSVLASSDVHDDLRDGPYRWSYAGARRLKGIQDPIPMWRVRALAARAA